MTREEAIETIKDICLTTEQLTRIEKALECLLSQPSLPSNLDEAAEKNFETMDVLEHENIFEETHNRIFKAGAEWMAGQGVKAHCVESSNPVSDSKDENLHLITLVYAENENTPYVLAGDEVEIILRKK